VLVLRAAVDNLLESDSLIHKRPAFSAKKQHFLLFSFVRVFSAVHGQACTENCAAKSAGALWSMLLNPALFTSTVIFPNKRR
jgi:hypothetical protein